MGKVFEKKKNAVDPANQINFTSHRPPWLENCYSIAGHTISHFSRWELCPIILMQYYAPATLL